jgi:protein-S-isoprenylcysteine O-methyltransferase Ste14
MTGGTAAANLPVRAWGGLAFLLILLGALLFLCAGRLDYWEAWLFLLAFGVPVAFITRYFLRTDPALIARRVDAGMVAEPRVIQKVIQGFASLAFIALVVVPGLDRRLGWSAVPPAIVVLADVFVVLGLSAVFFVFRENTFTSATIEVGEGQRVVTTGPYAVVRHPMYAGALVMVFAMPIALGSLVALIPTLPMLAAIVWRLLDEERYLVVELPGYVEYQKHTRYRLAPLLW